MNNLEAKQEAIKNAWINEFGLSEYKTLSKYIGDNGFCDFDYSEEGKRLCIKYNNLSKKNIIFNDQFKFIPFSLCGLYNNNGWIRIEADGNNLPDKGDFMVYWWDGEVCYVKQNYKTVQNLFQGGLITHYKPITPELKPIY